MAAIEIPMSLLARALRLTNEWRIFGSVVLVRPFAKAIGKHDLELQLPEIGPVFLRAEGSDYHTLAQVFVENQYDISTVPQYKKIVSKYHEILARKKTPVIIDAGANIGAAALYFTKLFPRAHLVAVEPDPDNIRYLRRNIERHDNIQLLEAAIGSRAGSCALAKGAEAWATQTVRSAEGEAKLVTVADVMAACGTDAELFIVKVDIEGFESDLFAESTEWLDGVSVLFVELHDWLLPGQGSSKSFQRAILARDFELLLLGENLCCVR